MAGKPIKISTVDKIDHKKQLIVFTHIPKSGGTSFHAALNAILNLNYLHLIPGHNNPPDIDALSGIGGHFNFESPSINHSEKDRIYTTLVRHPVDRLVSFYKHVIARPGHHLPVQNPDLLEMDALSFFKALSDLGNNEVDNLQCRLLCEHGPYTAQKAIQNIEDFYAVCLPLSAQQKAINTIAKMCNRNSLKVQKLNTSTPKLNVEITPELIRYIENTNSEDMTLYEHVQKQSA